MSKPEWIQDHPSPNHEERAGGVRPDMLVLHYTGMVGEGATLGRLCDPKAAVSAHYVVAEDGRVLRLVDEARRAWHAGASEWGGVADVNSRSIGVEIANRGHQFGYHPFPEPQIEALERLLEGVMARWAIPPERVVGHACIAPGRKIDPGEKFDWRRLALGGLSVWLDGPPAPARGRAPDAVRFQRAARAFGFPAAESGRWDGRTRDCWRAFVGRFRPADTGLPPHAAGVEHLEALARRWPVRLDAALADS